VLVHQPSGERLVLMLSAGPGQVRDMTIIADAWKAVGVEPNIYQIPPALDRDRQTRSTLPGGGVSQAPGDQFYTYKLHSSAITTAANSWSGLNRGGYNNPRVDPILEQLVTTIDPTQRVALNRELLQEQMGDIAIMPLNWPVRTALALKSVQGVTGSSTWNINEWDKQS
jgi:ABC-type transport system substrate-binding protein